MRVKRIGRLVPGTKYEYFRKHDGLWKDLRKDKIVDIDLEEFTKEFKKEGEVKRVGIELEEFFFEQNPGLEKVKEESKSMTKRINIMKGVKNG